jgi:hypothetical protein
MCELTSGNTKNDCPEASGVVEWYASSLANITSTTIASGEVTAVTMVATKKFFPIKVDPETSSYQDSAEGGYAEGLGHKPTATIITKGYKKTDYTFQKELESGKIVLIAKRANGGYMMLFREFGGKALVTVDSGSAFSSFNGSTIVVTGSEIERSVPVDPAIIAALIA